MTPTPFPKKSKPKHHPALFWTVIITIVAAVIFGATLVISSFAKKTLSFPNVMNKNQYYAVFLDNGQVYFGHLNRYLTSKNPVLSDIYYLQSNEALQTGEKKIEEAAGETQFNLVKLGQELHGPKDAMILNKDHILFIEELKTDGQVVKAIEEHKKEKK
ncbi:MAG: hypothetical protein AB1465_04260 [Patescibacteria group bacterium]